MRDKFVDFVADERIGCGYSCPVPGQVTTVWPPLLTGIGRVHFAGEHAGLEFSSFMEGALCSGVRVAKRLAVRDGLVKS